MSDQPDALALKAAIDAAVYGLGGGHPRFLADEAYSTIEDKHLRVLLAAARQHTTILALNAETEQVLAEARAITLAAARQRVAPDHVCGLIGFNGMIDSCPACETKIADRAKLIAARQRPDNAKLIAEIDEWLTAWPDPSWLESDICQILSRCRSALESK